MISNSHHLYSFTTMILLLISCSGRNSAIHKYAADDLTVNSLRIRNGRSLQSNEWKCYALQYDRICCPLNWQPDKQSNYLFYTQLEDSDLNTFFVVLRHDTLMNKLNLDNYLRALYVQLREDTIELFKEYTLNELVFDDKKAFYGEFTTIIDDSLFLSFVMYTEVHGLVYDLTLKTPLKLRELYRELFQDLLYNYQANGKFLFSESDELASMRKIDITTF